MAQFQTAYPQSPTFTFFGARSDNTNPYVELGPGPGGTVAMTVKKATAVTMSIMAVGQSYTVAVDGGSPASFMAPNTGVWTEVPVVPVLSTGQHNVLVMFDADTLFQWAKTNGVFVQHVFSTLFESALAPGQKTTFWVDRTTAIDLTVKANGALFRVFPDDRFVWPPETAPTTGLAWTKRVLWGLNPGKRSVSIICDANSPAPLMVQKLWLYSSAALPKPLYFPTVPVLEKLVVFGDSISAGQGGLMVNDGYAPRLAAKKGWELVNMSLGGQNAHCYAETHAWGIAFKDPTRVLVAFGVNDMIPGAGYDACDDPDTGTYRTAMNAVLAKIRHDLPNAKLYVGAILPTSRASDATRAQWNAQAQAAAAQVGAQFFDPSSTVVLGNDFPDGLHPNNRGHEAIASGWAAAITN